jgi:hypothetical protein
MKNYHEPQVPKLTDSELLYIFPQFKQIAPALMKELRQRKTELLQAIISCNANINAESSDETYRYFWKLWLIQPLRDEVKTVEQKLARLRRQLRIIKGTPIPKGALNNDLILAAKAVPIESIFNQRLRKTGNMLTGLCPFSEERTASFFVYKNTNRCWCFGCQQGGNTIDTYMKLNDCNFNYAVLALTGGEK